MAAAAATSAEGPGRIGRDGVKERKDSRPVPAAAVATAADSDVRRAGPAGSVLLCSEKVR